MDDPTFWSLLEKAVEDQAPLFDPAHRAAFRLFNGFTEGNPDLVIDLYGSTLVFHNYAEDPAQGIQLIQQAKEFLLKQVPWLRAGILNTRMGKTQEVRRGTLLFGKKPDHKIIEHGIWYAVDLTMKCVLTWASRLNDNGRI
jgi:23S rRNA (cytosine1962-C5)-methyltransferase